MRSILDCEFRIANLGLRISDCEFRIANCEFRNSKSEIRNFNFVGYQARGTPGHGIQKYGPRRGYVELDGRRYTIEAGVHTGAGYSAHADQRALLQFVKGMRKQPREIRLVHGSAPARAALRSLQNSATVA